jgi:hypothetical protein
MEGNYNDVDKMVSRIWTWKLLGQLPFIKWGMYRMIKLGMKVVTKEGCYNCLTIASNGELGC